MVDLAPGFHSLYKEMKWAKLTVTIVVKENSLYDDFGVFCVILCLVSNHDLYACLTRFYFLALKSPMYSLAS